MSHIRDRETECDAIRSAVAAGILARVDAFDGAGCVIVAYLPTPLARQWFGLPPLSPTT